jgi:TRAP-type C4-dicarboxylate transport system permease small subunit
MSDRSTGKTGFVVWATEALSTISSFWVLLLCAIFLYDILGRELFDSPFLGAHEIVGNSIVGILFLELPSSIKRGAMLRTTIVFNSVSPFMRSVIDCISYAFGVALFLAIIVGGWDAMIVGWQIGEIEGAGAFEVPVYPVRTLIIVFSGICALVYLQLFYLTVTGKIRPARG